MGNICSTDEIPKTPAEIPEYMISIKSGHEHEVGRTSRICFVFINTDGKRSKDIEYVRKRGKTFKPGTVTNFPVYYMPDLGKLDTMELTQTSGDDWFVHWVEVMDSFTREKFMFPVNRWMKAEKKIILKIYDVLLPQDDENIKQRKNELDEKRSLYEFDWRLPAGAMPMCKNTPVEDQLTKEYMGYLTKLKNKLLRQGLFNLIKSKKWQTLGDTPNVYGGLFVKPPGVESFREDRKFGTRRLNGANPGVLRLCTSIPDNLPVTNEMLKPIIENMTIEDAIEKKKLFIVNLANLTDLPCKTEEDKKRICTPIALFFVNKDQDLMPIAIQLLQTPGTDNPIFLPTDPEYTWLLAKMWFNSADATEHQSAIHLGLTHFLLESACVATHRCISPSHPIFRLLMPHFYGVLGINMYALIKLINIGGYVDKIHMCGTVGTLENASRAQRSWRLDVQGNLPNDLRDRGVDDPEVLPNCHYRDDGMLLWDAIKKYVTIVVEGHYNTLKKLEEDTEIQDWARTLSCESTGCGMKGVPGEGSFSTREQLIETVTSFIYISSAVHCAVNSTQYDTYSSPFGCMHLIGTPPTDKTPVDESFILSTLLDKKGVLGNMLFYYVLSTQGSSNRLSDFEIDYQFDPIGTEALGVFRKDLKAIAATIEERNAKREVPYPYLHPKAVTNSTGI